MKLKYEFGEYEKDNEDIKWDIINLKCKELEIDDINKLDVVDIIESLDVWDVILNKNIETIKKIYEWEAREYYENNNL